MSSSRVNGDFLDDELIERGDRLRSGDVVAVAEAQPTASPFTARVNFTLLSHDEQAFAPA